MVAHLDEEHAEEVDVSLGRGDGVWGWGRGEPELAAVGRARGAGRAEVALDEALELLQGRPHVEPVRVRAAQRRRLRGDPLVVLDHEVHDLGGGQPAPPLLVVEVLVCLLEFDAQQRTLGRTSGSMR